MRLLPSVLREEGGGERGVDMRGETFTGEKCSKAGLDREDLRIKPGDFQIQNTSIDGKPRARI